MDYSSYKPDCYYQLSQSILCEIFSKWEVKNSWVCWVQKIKKNSTLKLFFFEILFSKNQLWRHQTGKYKKKSASVKIQRSSIHDDAMAIDKVGDSSSKNSCSIESIDSLRAKATTLCHVLHSIIINIILIFITSNCKWLNEMCASQTFIWKTCDSFHVQFSANEQTRLINLQTNVVLAHKSPNYMLKQ